MTATQIDLDYVVGELRDVLSLIDSLMDDDLTPPAAAHARTARRRVADMLEDFLDLVEVDDALAEAGDARIDWEDFQADLHRP